MMDEVFGGYGYEDENWAHISGYVDYIISDFGRVWSYKSERFLKLKFDRNGYAYVCLSVNGQVTNKYIHRLVSSAFIFCNDEATWVNHDDGDKTYNYFENLEWVTPRENSLHAYKTGLRKPPNCRSVRIIETGEIFDSLRVCGRSIGVSHTAIRYQLSGKIKTCKGYTFEYV